jgi:hypothetical protein
MEKTELTVRVPRVLLGRAERSADKDNTTLTRLVSEYLRRLSTQGDPLPMPPSNYWHLCNLMHPDSIPLSRAMRRSPR